MNWTRGKLIGHGSSAMVFLAKSLPSGDTLAAKSIEYSRAYTLQKEQEIHSSLKCDRIIEYKGCDVTLEDGKLFYNILLEYASGGTVMDVIQKKDGGITEPLVRRYTKEIVQGIEYLHSKGMVHCDIKGANILVTSDGVKIGDFGCCRRFDDLSSTKIGGTPIYMAPEVARGEQQSYPSDVWALGCIVFEMATGLSPWPNISQDPLSALYHIGFSGALPEIPDFLPGQAKDFLSKCFKKDPKERWSVAELLKHPFVCEDGPFHGPSLDTPTSILDQGIWKTLEDPYIVQKNMTHVRSTKSPFERLRELIVNSSSDEFPNWASDEDWITARSNKIGDEAESIFSGLGLISAQIIQPNMAGTSGLCPTFAPNFLFLSLELPNRCKDSMYSMCSCKSKSDEIMKSYFTCNYMDINFCSINIMEYFLLASFWES